jgi:hypothetical protein
MKQSECGQKNYWATSIYPMKHPSSKVMRLSYNLFTKFSIKQTTIHLNKNKGNQIFHNLPISYIVTIISDTQN